MISEIVREEWKDVIRKRGRFERRDELKDI